MTFSNFSHGFILQRPKLLSAETFDQYPQTIYIPYLVRETDV